MEVSDCLYTFPQTIERDGVENTITPAAVETAKETVFIDTGYPDLTDQIEDNLASAGFDWDDVAAFLLTHQDTDHAESLSTVVNHTGADHLRTRARRALRRRPEGADQVPRRRAIPRRRRGLEPVGGVSFNTATGPMDVIFTPGYAPGHVSLHVPEAGVLPSADALTREGDSLQGPKPEYTPDMAEALDSASSLAALEFNRTPCYHGGLVEAGPDRVAEVVDAAR